MPVCKKCRRIGEKLFLKGEKCSLPKCPMIKKNYPPGEHGGSGHRRSTEYGVQLSLKQRLKNIYGLREEQLKNYFNQVRNKPGDIGELLLQRLEMRLDNVVYRSGIADSRKEARQMISHGFFLVDEKKVNKPSFKVKIENKIRIKDNKAKKAIITEKIKKISKKDSNSQWIVFDPKEQAIKIAYMPTRKDIGEDQNVQMVIEYYSR